MMKELTVILISIGLMLASGCKEDENKPETGTVTDIDGNVYTTVKIGDQWWMAENLKAAHYRDGDSISNITVNALWSALDSGAQCSYDNDPGKVDIYGRLYNWYAANDVRNIAPVGWHVATNDEWINMITLLGGEITAGDKLDDYGFNTYPGGYRGYLDGSYTGIDTWAGWWTSTAYDTDNAWGVSTSISGSWIGRASDDKRNGYAVRCVKD